VTRYPQDVFGWTVLGEVQYHANQRLGLSDDSLRAPFERATELDSSYVPAYLHTTELAFDRADTTRLFRNLHMLERFDAYPDVTRRYRLSSQIVWGDADSVAGRVDRLTATWPDAALRTGRVLEQIGNRARASAVYAQAFRTLERSGTSEALRDRIRERLTALVPGP
jgi:hypothetical protein